MKKTPDKPPAASKKGRVARAYFGGCFRLGSGLLGVLLVHFSGTGRLRRLMLTEFFRGLIPRDFFVYFDIGHGYFLFLPAFSSGAVVRYIQPRRVFR